MREVVLKYKLYKYEELDAKAKQRIKQRYREDNEEGEFVCDHIKEFWENEVLPVKGFTDVEIQCSGFGSQGDGASFTAEINLLKVFNAFEEEFRKKDITDATVLSTNDYFEFRCTRKYDNYVHEKSVGIEYTYSQGYDSVTEGQCDMASLIAEVLESIKDGLCYKLYNELEEGYFSVYTDEYLDETISNYENEYYADGEVFAEWSAEVK